MFWRNLRKEHTGGGNFVVEEPEFNLKPEFKPKIRSS